MSSSLSPEARRVAKWMQRVVGLLTWLVVFLALFGPFFFPVGALWVFSAFGLYAALNSLKTVVWGQVSLRRITQSLKTSFESEYEAALAGQQQNGNGDHGALLSDPVTWNEVVHAVIIPNYKEPVELMHETITAIASQAEARRTILVLAMEEKEEGCETKAEEIKSHFKPFFLDIMYTKHPMGLENEVQGKASNEAWAAKQLYSKVQQMNIDVDRVIVTIADADSLLPEKYFACLTYKFCTDPGRLRRFWQAHITFLRNIYRIPPLTRIIDMLLATDHLSWVSSTDILIPMSTYSVSLHLLHRSGYWDVDVTDEDFHLFCKAVLLSQYDDVKTIPIYLPIQLTSCESATTMKTLTSRFGQARRHAMGARTIGYVLTCVWTNSVRTSQFPRDLIWRLFMMHFFGPACVMCLAIGWPIWKLFNSSAELSSSYSSAFYLIRVLNVVGAVLGVCSIILMVNFFWMKRLYLRQWPAIGDILGFICAPITTIVYIYLPILIAQTDLFWKDNIPYTVADKPQSTGSQSLRHLQASQAEIHDV